MNFYSFLKPLGFFLHYAISQSKLTTIIYINLLSIVLRRIPSTRLKQRVINSINSIKWLNDIDLAPRTIQVGTNNSKLKIIPHFYEFDFEAVVNPTLSYEKEVFACLESRLTNYDTIIEIGANVGIFSLFFASYLEQHGQKTNIFVFEPSREAYLRLLKNIKINCIQSIQAFNIAISDEVKFINFFEPEGHLTNGSLDQNFAEQFAKSVVNQALAINGKVLDTLVDKSEYLLIKIDTEGSEYSVMRSLESLIKQKKVEFLIEVLPSYQNQLNNLEFLFEQKYSFFNITDQGLVKYEKFVASRFRDYILLPPSD